MALKPDRNYDKRVELRYHMHEVAERGVVVVFDNSTSGAGAGMDDAGSRVKLPDNDNGSGEKPAGILVCDVVNKDLTQTHLNAHKDEVQLGSKVTVVRGGVLVTDRLETGLSPAAGDAAYFTQNGLLSMDATNSTKIGTFLTAKDTDGFAAVEVNL
jgi:hypothetical protein